MKVWVVTSKSESGDVFPPEVFTKKPSEKILKALAFSQDGDEDNPDGAGDYGSWVHLKVTRVIADSFKPTERYSVYE